MSEQRLQVTMAMGGLPALTWTAMSPLSCDLLRASPYAEISPLSIRSLKLQSLESTWEGTNCSTVWTWYLSSGTLYRGDTVGKGAEPRADRRRALMTEMVVKIKGPDTTLKAKLEGVLRN